MNCHINVENCAAFKAIQYVFKYQMKGTDQATISTGIDDNNRDEVTTYQNKRWLSSMEASWRILQFNIVQTKPSIIRLPVHLEREQYVIYNPHNQTQTKKALKDAECTKLIGYFKANVEFENARTVHYKHFPEFFVWNIFKKKWTPRTRITSIPTSIGRLRTVHPSNEEEFCLRQLLLHRLGCRSFDAIKTIDGTQHETFKSACIKLGLFANDYLWIECMQEACAHHSPISCRQLFIYILNECSL